MVPSMVHHTCPADSAKVMKAHAFFCNKMITVYQADFIHQMSVLPLNWTPQNLSKKKTCSFQIHFSVYCIYKNKNNILSCVFLKVFFNPSTKPVSSIKETPPPQPQVLPTPAPVPLETPKNSSAELLDSLMFQFSIPRSNVDEIGTRNQKNIYPTSPNQGT